MRALRMMVQPIAVPPQAAETTMARAIQSRSGESRSSAIAIATTDRLASAIGPQVWIGAYGEWSENRRPIAASRGRMANSPTWTPATMRSGAIDDGSIARTAAQPIPTSPTSPRRAAQAPSGRTHRVLVRVLAGDGAAVARG